jgi:hypothetical protein
MPFQNRKTAQNRHFSALRMMRKPGVTGAYLNFQGLRIMSRQQQILVQKRKTKLAGQFVEQLKEAAGSGAVFDSAAAADFVGGALSQAESPMPRELQVLMDETPADSRGAVTKAILDGVRIYEEKHGTPAPADLIEYAMHLGYGHTSEGIKLDSANSNHGDNLSLQPNRAVVSILMALSEGIPFVHYLPADIGSNEAKIGIVSHLAGSNYGRYAQNALMDGVNNGDAYITPSRIHTCARAADTGFDNHTGQLTSAQTDEDTCTAVGGNVVAVKLLRGRSVVYVNGKIVAREVSSAGSGNSTVSGSVTISGTTYQIGGTINTDTGAIALTTTPGIGAGVPLVVEGFIDYERQPELIPSIISNGEMFSIFAKPWRAYTQVTPDARSQMINELGVDPLSEALVNIQMQYANERHYELLWKAKRIALGNTNTGTFDIAWSTQGSQKNRAQIWQDFSASLGAISQQMAIDTLGFGISHLYVGKYMKAQLEGLPAELFQSSGIQERPGIFRLGRLFGRYEVYFSPKVLTDSNSASQVLCIGRAPDVARNPFVAGDAVAPNLIDLAVGTDLKRGQAFYGRGFNEVTPFAPSTNACALINITNMGL